MSVALAGPAVTETLAGVARLTAGAAALLDAPRGGPEAVLAAADEDA